ncbi:hypothetical protein Tco_0759152 [Tanacetum coccineum]
MKFVARRVVGQRKTEEGRCVMSKTAEGGRRKRWRLKFKEDYEIPESRSFLDNTLRTSRFRIGARITLEGVPYPDTIRKGRIK